MLRMEDDSNFCVWHAALAELPKISFALVSLPSFALLRSAGTVCPLVCFYLTTVYDLPLDIVIAWLYNFSV